MAIEFLQLFVSIDERIQNKLHKILVASTLSLAFAVQWTYRSQCER